jgi:hypothetical protein
VEGASRLLGLRLVPVHVDFRVLGDERNFVLRQGHGARLGSIAHLFASISTVSLASSFFVADLFPWGSHPLLDPCYSSSSVEVRHEGVGFRRLESVRVLRERPDLLQFLIVCSEMPIDERQANCGRCEKCLRTMLELEIAGLRESAISFPPREIFLENLDALSPAFWNLPFWRELVEPLRERGRVDLASAVSRLIERGTRHREWVEETNLKGRVRRFDRRYLGGRLLEMRRRMR